MRAGQSRIVTILRFPLVAAGFVVEHLRRLPGAGWFARRRDWFVAGLLLASLLAFILWGLQPTPQRVTLADLRAGRLPATSSWIIISGEMVDESPSAAGLVYRLTDGSAPNSWMLVHSETSLTVGHTTVSGTYFGQRDLVPEGYAFIGQMHADPVLAPEQPPPWIALALAAICLLVGIAGRFSYPTFFSEPPGSAVPRTTTVTVSVRDTTPAPAARPVRGKLRLQLGSPVTLRVEGAGEQLLRLHSAYTSAELGELRRLTGSVPTLRIHQPKGDIDISFASRDERDAAFAALAADAELRRATARAERGHSTRVEEGTSDS